MSSSPVDCSTSQALSTQLSELVAALSCFDSYDYNPQLRERFLESNRNIHRRFTLQAAVVKVIAMHAACDRAAATVERTTSSVVFYVATQPLASPQLQDEMQRCIDSWAQTAGQEELEALIVQHLYNLGLTKLRELSEGSDNISEENLAPGLRPHVEAVVRILQEVEPSPDDIKRLHRVLCKVPVRLSRTEESMDILCTFAQSVACIATHARLFHGRTWRIIWVQEAEEEFRAHLPLSLLNEWFNLDTDNDSEQAPASLRIAVSEIQEREQLPQDDFTKNGDSYHADRSLPHAESLLMSYINKHGLDVEAVIGTSDDSCYPCLEYMKILNSLAGRGFQLMGCNWSVEIPMSFPEMDGEHKERLAAKLLDTLRILVRNRARDPWITM